MAKTTFYATAKTCHALQSPMQRVQSQHRHQILYCWTTGFQSPPHHARKSMDGRSAPRSGRLPHQCPSRDEAQPPNSLSRCNDLDLLPPRDPPQALKQYVPNLQTARQSCIRPCRVSRCGYTGEDGFELSLANEDASRVAKMLMSHPDVELIGLGARDSLRLEAGFCLYGHDIDTTITPIEADLSWIMNKRRRQEAGFLGDSVILDQIANRPLKRRVGLLPDGPAAPAREGAKLFNDQMQEIGVVTSGGFGPTIGGPVAMGYVTLPHDQLGTSIFVEVRGRKSLWRVTDLPFTPYRTYNAKRPTQH